MNVLVIGSGGREHAISWKIAQSPLLSKLFIAPGNAGTAELGENASIGVSDFDGIEKLIRAQSIDLVVIGPEEPLVKGLVDYLKSIDDLSHVGVVGPAQTAAQLEGSKEYAKEFMTRHGVPTAAYQSFTADTLAEGKAFLATLTPPFVLKADGLAAGKGVLILQDLTEAQTELENMLVNAKFGQASTKVVIEEFLKGIELSVFVLTDGKSYRILPEAKDYKRIGEGDTGLNTGGMGAVSPVPFAQGEFLKRVEEEVVKPTIAGFEKDGMDYKGFVFIGLMNDNGTPKVVEYNVRMGDPETEVVIPRIKSDLLALLAATAKGTLNEVSIEIDERTATTVMLVSGGYPESYEKGKVMSGFDQVKGDQILFHAGTAYSAENVVTNGGRVLAVTNLGNGMKDALAGSYEGATAIKFDGVYFRRDIGFDL